MNQSRPIKVFFQGMSETKKNQESNYMAKCYQTMLQIWKTINQKA